jgi:hypothetical protein
MGKNQSKDFRYVFTNAFAVRMGDNDITLTFGMHEGGPPEEMLEEVAVVMTPRTLKIIVNNVGNAIKAFESQMGEIPVPPEKLPTSFDEMIKAGAAVIEVGVPAIEKPKEAPATKKPKK